MVSALLPVVVELGVGGIDVAVAVGAVEMEGIGVVGTVGSGVGVGARVVGSGVVGGADEGDPVSSSS